MALAIVVHVAFFAFLYFGVSWQRKQPEPLVAELWSELPPPKPLAPIRVEPNPVVDPNHWHRRRSPRSSSPNLRRLNRNL
jgi:hypothetical protein